MSIISIKNLIHDYAKHDDAGTLIKAMRAVNDVSLDVKEGDFIAILGHNGSGKSTLAKHINALLFPTEGKVFVCGNDTEDEDLTLEIRKNAGMVFQNPDNQIIATVVDEDVAFGPENLGIPTEKMKRYVKEALETVEMTAYADADPNKLSGGQKQRVAIAGVLAMRPKCIVLDEPTAMLDPIGRHEVIDTVKRLNREEGMTVVLVTHHMDEVIDADKLYVMNKGQIEMGGTPREVFADVEKIKSLGLDVPQSTELAFRLTKAGYPMPTCLDAKEFTEEFTRRYPDAVRN